MARVFTGSTANRLVDSGANFSGWGSVTMACWANSDALSGTQTMMSVTDDNRTDRYLWFYLSSGGGLVIGTRWGSSFQSAGTSATTSAGVWYHACAIRGSDIDRRVYLNGGSKGTSTADDGFSSASFPPDAVAVGVLHRTTEQDAFDGPIAWPCIWNVILTDDEVATLAAGVHPLSVRPESIAWFSPLTGASTGNEIDIIGGRTLTETGAVGTAESPLVALGSPIRVLAAAAAAGGGTTGILRNQTRAIERGHSGVAAAHLGGVLA